MKIESTKNLFKEIEGVNAFEVKTVGKRKDLEELKSRLKVNGFNFNENGGLLNCYERMKALIEYARELSGENKLKAMEVVNSIQNDVNEYLSLHVILKECESLEFTYTLDMSNIEILIEEDECDKITGKAIINLKANEDTDELLFWKETNLEKDEVINKRGVDGKAKVVTYVELNGVKYYNRDLVRIWYENGQMEYGNLIISGKYFWTNRINENEEEFEESQEIYGEVKSIELVKRINRIEV